MTANTQFPAHGGVDYMASQPTATQEPFDERLAAQSIRDERAASPTWGVLLVNHGSHSPTWRRMLLDVHAEVRDELLAIPNVQSVRSGFMEYTEPSIATQLKALDEDGVDRILIVPLLLTISSHSFDDIPNICGLKNDPEVIESLRKENIERHTPLAPVEIAPLLDYPKLVRKNLARRVGDLRSAGGSAPGRALRDGCVLVGYGSAEFDAEWRAFFEEIGDFATSELGIATTTWSWCGHLVKYSPEPTTEAIREVLGEVDRAIVVPLLVAHDEMFQEKIIRKAIRGADEPERILYHADAILPEPAVGRWVVSIVKETILGG